MTRADGSLVVEGVRIAGGGVATIRIEGGRVTSIGPARRNGAPPGAAHGEAHVDGAGLLASIGLLDLQVNGAAGHDLTSDPESIWAVGAALPRSGVTAFLPTLVSPAFDVVDRAREAFLAGPPDGYTGATPLGWHVEGPFLNPARAGAHDPACLCAPNAPAVAGWSPETGVRIATLAPELPGALEIVRALAARGVTVSVGHTEATRDEAAAAFDAGARFVTHLFNAMPKDHTAPGVVAAALADERVTVGIIPDGLHVEPERVALVHRSVGTKRLAIVTDAIAALGMPPGRHRLANRDVEVDEESARLPSGVLAGSVLSLDEGVRNLAAYAGIAADEALLAATATPADLLGLPARARLAAGGIGDLVLFDANLAPVLTVVGGRVAHDALEPGRWA